MNTAISNHIDEISKLCVKHNIRTLHSFGSVNGPSFNEESDIDFLVSFMPMAPEDYADHYFDLVDELEQLLERPVDLLTDKSLSNPYFVESVNRTKQLIYG